MGNTATLHNKLTRCRIDVGIMTLVEPSATFDCTLIGTPRLMVCLRSDDAWAQRHSLQVKDLAGRPLVMREPGSQTRALLESIMARSALVPAVTLKTGTREATREAVAAGLGIGVMFDDEHGHDVRLALVPLQGTKASPGVFAVTLRESLGVPAVRTFVGCIRANPVVANGTAYRRPRRPVVVVCIDGGDPRYLQQFLGDGSLRHIARFVREGFAVVADGSMPSFTCPNNMSIITGTPTSVHGISGNFYLDTTTW